MMVHLHSSTNELNIKSKMQSESIFSDIASNPELNGARGFARKSCINHENSSREKTNKGCLQEANTKIEEMRETMEILTKSPLLWATFKSRLSTSNHGNGIVAVQMVLQEFVDDHPEIETILLALKRKKEAASRHVQPRLSTGFMETVNSLSSTASIARRFSVDVSSQLSSIMLGDGPDIKAVSSGLSLPPRTRSNTFPHLTSIASPEVKRFTSTKKQDEGTIRKALCGTEKNSSRDFKDKASLGRLFTVDMSSQRSSMMPRDGPENVKLSSRLSLPSRYSRSTTFPSRASLIISPETAVGQQQHDRVFSSGTKTVSKFQYQNPSTMNTLLEIDEGCD